MSKKVFVLHVLLFIFSFSIGLIYGKEILRGINDFNPWATEDVSGWQKSQISVETAMKGETRMLPKANDIVFVFAGADHQGRDFLPLATIIDPHTGVESNCILESRAELQIIDTKAERTLLVVRNEPKQAMSGSCIKGQEIFLDVKIVSYFKERGALKLKIAEVEWELKMLETLPLYLPSRQK